MVACPLPPTLLTSIFLSLGTQHSCNPCIISDNETGTWNVELAPKRELSEEEKSLVEAPDKLNGDTIPGPEYGETCDHEGRFERPHRASLMLRHGPSHPASDRALSTLSKHQSSHGIKSAP